MARGRGVIGCCCGLCCGLCCGCSIGTYSSSGTSSSFCCCNSADRKSVESEEDAAPPAKEENSPFPPFLSSVAAAASDPISAGVKRTKFPPRLLLLSRAVSLAAEGTTEDALDRNGLTDGSVAVRTY